MFSQFVQSTCFLCRIPNVVRCRTFNVFGQAVKGNLKMVYLWQRGSSVCDIGVCGFFHFERNKFLPSSQPLLISADMGISDFSCICSFTCVCVLFNSCFILLLLPRSPFCLSCTAAGTNHLDERNRGFFNVGGTFKLHELVIVLWLCFRRLIENWVE